MGSPSMLKKSLAWCAHLYTAFGLIAAAGIAVTIYHGDFHYAFVLMFLAVVVDATDGTFARAVKVKDVLPHFDGRRLDDLIDFHTYTTLPLFLIWRANLLPHEWQGFLIAPLLASAYGFCQTNAKTDDGYFLGFPSYWNIVAFYLYVLEPPAWLTLSLLLFFALMTFLPMRYLYPTHRGRLNRWTNVLGAIWGVLLIAVLWRFPESRSDGRNVDPATFMLAAISLAFPIYYLGVSWYITARIVYRAVRQHRI
jgi:phosphatidylcholine synthase